MFAKLTDLGGGAFSLPVVETFPVAKDVQRNGVVHPAAIFRDGGAGWSDQDLNDIGYARVTESVVGPNYDATGHSDAMTNGVVVRTYAVALKPLANLKATKKAAVNAHRAKIAAGGLTFSGQPVATDAASMGEVNLIFAFLNAGQTFPGGSIPWTTMTGAVLNVTEAQFLAFAKAAALHFIKATKAARAHLDAISALTGKQAVADYDLTVNIVGSEWPANPVI